LLFLFSFTFFGVVHSQATTELTSQSTPTEWLKISNPITGQKIVSGQELEMGGESSDYHCQKLLSICHSNRPYQKASAAGPSGDSDFSKWRYSTHKNYTISNEGKNKIIAKLSCLTPLATRWHNAIITAASTTETVKKNEITTASMRSESNSTGMMEDLHTLRSEEPNFLYAIHA